MEGSPKKRGRRLAGWASGSIFSLAMLGGVTSDQNPLLRLACALSLSAFLLVAAFLLIRRPAAVGPFLGTILCIAMLTFFGLIVTASWWGGGALNGRMAGGRYYLASHGVETETTRLRYCVSAAVETLLLVSWPLLFLAVGYLDHRTEAAREIRLERRGQSKGAGRPLS
jgi:hypothetical protein